MPLPLMPVDTLIEHVCDDGADYADGDDPGYFSGTWEADNGALILTYSLPEDVEDDDDDAARYAETTITFRPVTSPPADLGREAYDAYHAVQFPDLDPIDDNGWDDSTDRFRAAWQAAAEVVWATR